MLAEIERAPRVGVSPVSCFELALVHHRSRLELPLPVRELVCFGVGRFKLDKYLLKMCRKDRLLELMHDFVLFDGGVKKLPRVHQYFGIKAAQKYVKRHQSGIVWHTQGSGRSIIMVLLARWILENNPKARVAIITDRDELDKQIERIFTEVDEAIYRTSSGSDLMRQLGQARPRLLCSLVHKFGRRDVADFDAFIKEPAHMKLLIVVDKLLTGFDAPPCTYLYIDKSMQDHGLFQAICRTNRLDGEDKDFGYIVDYKDLFKKVENAIAVYTGADIARIKQQLDHYLKLREVIRKASGESLDLKAYEADMRHLIDTYIQADEPRKISPFDDMSLLGLIVKTSIAEAIAQQRGALQGETSDPWGQYDDHGVHSGGQRQASYSPVCVGWLAMRRG